MSAGVRTCEQGCKVLESLSYAILSRCARCARKGRGWPEGVAGDGGVTPALRLLVMCDGEIMGALPEGAGEREIGLLMSGVREEAAA